MNQQEKKICVIRNLNKELKLLKFGKQRKRRDMNNRKRDLNPHLLETNQDFYRKIILTNEIINKHTNRKWNRRDRFYK